MSLRDELDQTVPRATGPRCHFLKIRDREGDDVFIEIMEVLLADGFTWAQKAQVLDPRGYGGIHKQTYERHSRHRILGSNGCRGCRRHLEEVAPELLEAS